MKTRVVFPCLEWAISLMDAYLLTNSSFCRGPIRSFQTCYWLPVMCYSIAQIALSLSERLLQAFAVPVPPLAEQHRIVAEVERRLSVIDELEAIVAANLKRAERLRQSILKRAFEGKLVPQDPKDEPASVLLERIRAKRQVEQKAAAKALSKPSQKRKRPQVAETQAELFR